MSARIERFSAKAIPHETWSVIGPLVRDAIRRVAPATPEEVTELASRTAALFAWCFARGLEPTPEVMLAPETLDRYVTNGCAHLAKGTRINYRRLLRRVGAAVLGPPLYPERAVPLETSGPVAPYTRDEERALAAWAHGLSTERMRNGAIALLGLGFGVGLLSIEMTQAQRRWVKTRAHGLDVQVTGPRSRHVACAARWEWALHHAVGASAGGFLFVPESAARHRKIVSTFTENLPRADAPKLSAQRMRATWLVRHLEARVPVNALAAAAGINGEELFRYVPAMGQVSADEAARFLRGEPT